MLLWPLPTLAEGGAETACLDISQAGRKTEGIRLWGGIRAATFRHWQKNPQNSSRGDELPGLDHAGTKDGGTFPPTQQDLLILNRGANTSNPKFSAVDRPASLKRALSSDECCRTCAAALGKSKKPKEQCRTSVTSKKITCEKLLSFLSPAAQLEAQTPQG